MSRSKNLATEAEKETTENLVEQPELSEATPKENLLKEGTEIVKPVVNENPKVSSVRANKAGKMGVYKFLSIYPQDKYMETLLKFYYPNSFFTKDGWYQRIEEIRHKPVR